MTPNVFDKMPQRSCHRISIILAYAFLEWILILLLFLNSFLSFLVAKFAAYFGLKPFCTFCSRLDHIWGSNGTPSFHLGHVCEAHGAEISGLRYCFSHGRLAEAKSLCGDCLFSDGMMRRDESEGNTCCCCGEVILSREVCDPSLVRKPCWDVGASIAEVIDADMDGEEASATVTDQSNSFSQADQMKHDGNPRMDFEECNDTFWCREWNQEEDESVCITDMILKNEDYVDPDEFICIELLDMDNKPPTFFWEDTEEDRVDKQLASLENDHIEDSALLSMYCLETDGRHNALEGSGTGAQLPCLVSEKGKAEAEGIGGRDDFKESEQLIVPNGHARAVGGTILQHSSDEWFCDIECADMELCEENVSGKQSEEGRHLPKAAMIDGSMVKLHEKPMTCEKVESQIEDSFEGDDISDIEVEHESSTRDHLKFKVKAQEKALNVLYDELDKERKAAAVAANETMAMITKLQEEKAMMQMEALQYQRMMEDQAEYDQEALQLLNDLMIKREKEKQELVIELEIYRNKVLEYEAQENRSLLRIRKESCISLDLEDEGDDRGLDIHHELSLDEDLEEERVECIPDSTPPDISLAEFDEERMSILEELKGLEAKLLALYDSEMQSPEDIRCSSEGSLNSLTNDLMAEKLLPLFTSSDTEFSGETSKFILIHEELGHVYERLQALEADKEFLKHCISSMKKGNEGLTLLQEILQHLRGLRSIEFPA